MKKLLAITVIAGSTIGVASACAPRMAEVDEVVASDSVFTFTHLDGHGTERDFEAHVVWENNAGSYHQFQIGYTSCICRPDATANHRNMIYLEYNKNTNKVQNATFNHYADSDFTVNTLSQLTMSDFTKSGTDDVMVAGTSTDWRNKTLLWDYKKGETGEKLSLSWFDVKNMMLNSWLDKVINGFNKAQITEFAAKTKGDYLGIAGASGFNGSGVSAWNLPRVTAALLNHYEQVISKK